MDAIITPLIRTLKDGVAFAATRSAPSSEDYFEAVVLRHHLPQCVARLSEALGPPAKEFGKEATFGRHVKALAEAIGGVRVDQCLFVKQLESGQLGYATLWPWASDPTRVTLKVGVHGGAV